MSDIAIRVENLSKQYRIGGKQASYRTFREALLDSFAAPVRWMRGERKSIETFWALDDVSFEIKQGEAVGIIGRNGAGKSTLLKVLSRITKPTKGRVDLYGRVASLLEVGTGFHPELTGRDNIYLNGAILGMSRREIDRKFDEIVDFAEIEKFLDTPVKHYSSGMYVRLAFAVAAHLEPEILVVDEVLAVGDINFRRKSLGKMNEVTRQGRTILFVSHEMSSIRQLCQRGLWLEKGEISKQGTAEEVTSMYERSGYKSLLSGTGHFERTSTPRQPFYIQWIELREKNNELQTQYVYGDYLNMVVGFNGDAPQDGFTLEWLLINEKGGRISFGTANPMSSFYINRKDRVIQCKLGPLPLTTGTYSFYLSVRVWGQERWDEWENAAGFQVVRCDPFNTGHDVPGGPGGDFIIPHVWSLINS